MNRARSSVEKDRPIVFARQVFIPIEHIFSYSFDLASNCNRLIPDNKIFCLRALLKFGKYCIKEKIKIIVDAFGECFKNIIMIKW